MFDQFAALLITPTLIQAQLPPSGLQADLKQGTEYSEPAVVRVVAGCYGTYSYSRNEYSANNEISLVTGEVGTGYIVSSDGHIVTNYHVLLPAEESGCKEQLFRRLVELVTGQSNFESVPEETKTSLRNRSQLKGNVEYISRVVLPTGASLPFEIKQTGTPVGGGGDDIAIIKIGVKNAPTIKLGSFSPAASQEAAATVGYPIDPSFRSLSSSSVSDSSSPSFWRDLSLGKSLGGAITLNGWVTKSNQGGLPTLQLNDSFPLGITGGPVISKKGEAIGLVTVDERTAKEGSTSALFIPAQTVQTFVKQAGVSNQPSQTDRLYREGLSLFSKGDFAAARATFVEVRKLFPYHLAADSLIRDADQKITEAQQKKVRLMWLTGAGLVLVAFLGLYISRRNQPLRRVFGSLVKRRPSRRLRTPAPAPGEANPVNLPEQQPEQRPASVTRILGNEFSPPTVMGSQPFIDLKNQDGQVRRFYLLKWRHQLGRDHAWADLCISDSGWEVLSRHHAVLEREGSGYRIYDGDRKNPSTNGIFLNGASINTSEGYLLQDGDQLITGNDPRNQVTLIYSNPVQEDVEAG